MRMNYKVHDGSTLSVIAEAVMILGPIGIVESLLLKRFRGFTHVDRSQSAISNGKYIAALSSASPCASEAFDQK